MFRASGGPVAQLDVDGSSSASEDRYRCAVAERFPQRPGVRRGSEDHGVHVELLQQGKLLASLNFNPIETYTVIAVVFFLCLFPLVQATYALERRLGRSDA